MQLIPRFKQWIGQYDPGIQLSFSEYSIDSGNKLVTDAIAEADVLGIFGREQVALATMWNPPKPTDPIAFSFMLFRNVNGRGLAFGDISVQAVSDDQGMVSAYGALRSAISLTLVLINKTTTELTTPVVIEGQSGTAGAQFYSYSNADLTAIHKLANVEFSAGRGSVTLPAYSMNMVVIPLD